MTFRCFKDFQKSLACNLLFIVLTGKKPVILIWYFLKNHHNESLAQGRD